jgi:stearoyl-CoA desaturase (Delta-9 desaturase)
VSKQEQALKSDIMLAPASDLPTMSTAVRVVKLAAVILPFLGFALLVVSLWNRGFNGTDLALLLGMYVATGLGITVGFHRLFTHRAFETNRAVEVALAILGSMAVQSNLLTWVALHRRHHQHSDTPQDPHSPHHHGEGVAGVLRGLWHAHVGWIFLPDPPGLSHYVKDLRQSRSLRVVSALFPLWVTLGLLIPAAVGGLAMGTWMGAFQGLVWGGLARIFLVHHVTWSINSICHLWGSQPHATGDHSRNSFLLGVVGLGEGWHNNHHASPASARYGWRWWQLDLGYGLIRVLALVGLASNIKLHAPHKRDEERFDSRATRAA